MDLEIWFGEKKKDKKLGLLTSALRFGFASTSMAMIANPSREAERAVTGSVKEERTRGEESRGERLGVYATLWAFGGKKPGAPVRVQ
jgi:hypothetical protein